MTRRVVVVVLLVAMAGAVAWVARFALSDPASSREEADRAPVSDEPEPEPPDAGGDDGGALPAQSAAERAQLIEHAFEADGRVAFVSVAAYLEDPDGVRWYAADEELPEGPVTALRAPVKDADAWLGALAGLPPFPILVAQWSDVTDAGVAHAAGLAAVEALRVSGSRSVTDEGARRLRGRTGLRLLDLGATGITDDGLVYLRELDALQVLRLYGTATGDAGLAHLRGLARLEALDAGVKATPDGVAQLRGAPLKRLDLGGLRGVKSLAPLSAFPDLRRLGLARTGVDDAALATLASLPHVNDLDLAHTAVTDQGLAVLRKLRELRRLDLAGVALTDAGARHVGACVRLRQLDLAATQVGNDGLARLKTLGVLEVLDLSATPTGDAGITHLAGLPRLRELHLPAGATPAVAESLRQMPALRRVVVDKSMKPEARTELKAALPRCRVE